LKKKRKRKQGKVRDTRPNLRRDAGKRLGQSGADIKEERNRKFYWKG